MSHLKDSAKAFELLLHQKKYTSTLGAIPEKIRLDGFAIGYWYSTPHGLFVWAFCWAVAHFGADGTLRLFYGLDGQWRDFGFKQIRLPGNVLVSAKVVDGMVESLVVSNETTLTKTICIDINSKYDRSDVPDTITVKPKEQYVWNSRPKNDMVHYQ